MGRLSATTELVSNNLIGKKTFLRKKERKEKSFRHITQNYMTQAKVLR